MDAGVHARGVRRRVVARGFGENFTQHQPRPMRAAFQVREHALHPARQVAQHVAQFGDAGADRAATQTRGAFHATQRRGVIARATETTWRGLRMHGALVKWLPVAAQHREQKDQQPRAEQHFANIFAQHDAHRARHAPSNKPGQPDANLQRPHAQLCGEDVEAFWVWCAGWMDEVHGGSGFKRRVYASSRPNRIDSLKKPPARTAGLQPAFFFPWRAPGRLKPAVREGGD